MNEEEKILTEETSAEVIAAEDIVGEVIPADVSDTQEELSARIGELAAENAALRRRLFCAENHIPAELAGDVMLLAEAESERDGVPFETAARSVWERLARIKLSSAPDRQTPACVTTTGAALKKSRSGSADPLRAAFGLKG